jgi:alpha-mannosidase
MTPRKHILRRRTFLGALCAAPLAARVASPDELLYLLTYDHGGLVLWGIPQFKERIHDAIAWLDRYPGFKIGLDNEAYTYDYLAAHDPAMLEEMRGYLKRYKGRFGIGTCTYGQPLSCFINEESNIRQIQYGLETDRKHFGVAPEIYLMSEHAQHSQLPQILAGFGFRAAIMRTHFMMYGYNPTFDAPFGRWIGLDGSSIPAVPTYPGDIANIHAVQTHPGDGSEFAKTTYDDWVLTRCPGPDCKGSLDEFKTLFRHIHPLIASRADDSGLRREGLVKQTEARSDCHWMLLEDLPGVFPAPDAEFKTAPNDFVVRMPWGYCGNEIFNQTRAAEISVLKAERLAAVGHLMGGPDHEEELEQSWKDLLVGQHHDVQICGLLRDARHFLGASLEVSRQVAGASLLSLAAHMKGGPGGQITVFNPNSWRRKEWVEATIELPAHFAKTVELRHGNDVVPSELVSALRDSSGFLQEARVAVFADVPPLSAVAYSVFAAKEETVAPAGITVGGSPLRIETPFWKVELHPEGGIAALNFKKTGAPVFQPGRRSACFAGRIDGVPCESKGQWRILPRTDALPWIEAREVGTIGGIPYHCELRLRTDSPRIEYRVKFEFDGQKIGQISEQKRDAVAPFVHEEKLRFKTYPATNGAPLGVRDLPFAVAETSDRYINGNYWTALAGPKTGIAFFNRGAMGSVHESDGGFSIPLAYSMYYVWGTRILSGEYSYEFAMWPFDAGWKQADLHRHALDYSYALDAVGAESGDGSLGIVARPIEVASEDVIATALYSRHGQIHLRLFEHRGANGKATAACQDRRWEDVDLAGRRIGKVTGAVEFHAWQIRTLRTDVKRT